MDVEDAKVSFLDTLSNLTPIDLQPFLNFVQHAIIEKSGNGKDHDDDHEHSRIVSKDCVGVADTPLQRIKTDLRSMLPLNAMLPSESISFPVHGEHAGTSESDTCHVDAFLYNDDDIDDLCDDGKMTRTYCKECGSKNTVPLNFITHSMSENQLIFIFRYVLTDLAGKTLLDVGSRIGAVLYGAYFRSASARIIGVEMNQDLCSVQNRIVQKYQLADRVQIICDDVCNQVQLLQSADVIILHNVFEFFIPVDAQTRIWNHLRQTIAKSGTVLVLSPCLLESVSHLKVDFTPADWLVQVDVSSQRRQAISDLEANEEEIESLHFYTVR